METRTEPASRFGWQGQTVEYVITAEGASEILPPAAPEDGLEVRVLSTRPTAEGLEARVAVSVGEGVLY